MVSLKVLDASGETSSSVVIAALDYVRVVQRRRPAAAIHGVNLSIGCDWYPDEFAAGQSPLCRSWTSSSAAASWRWCRRATAARAGRSPAASGDVSGQLSTITDPGNAANAITVGSTHRYAPHTYGVTFTSSKGPTLDGRLEARPGRARRADHVGGHRRAAAPASPRSTAARRSRRYIEDSGTSMAAPHVSGAIAAFLSVRSSTSASPTR